MEYRSLGRTGVKVSPLCLGTMNFGPRTTEEDAQAIMSKALEIGINFFDTANVYGQELGKGITEQIVGRWLAQDSSRRDQIVLATKVYAKMGNGPNEQRLSAYHIRRACDESLRRLQTDHIDLYQMHHVDRQTPWEEIWQAMELLIQQGKVIYVGTSNFAGWHLMEGNMVAQRRNLLGLVSEQCHYNLANRMVELEVLPAAQSIGMGVIAWSPLYGGVLGGKIKGAEEKARRATQQNINRQNQIQGQLDRWEQFCQAKGEEPADVALAWLLHNPILTAPIIGPRTMEQLTGSLPALEIKLSGEELSRINEIWPGPGGAAPEAWAW